MSQIALTLKLPSSRLLSKDGLFAPERWPHFALFSLFQNHFILLGVVFDFFLEGKVFLLVTSKHRHEYQAQCRVKVEKSRAEIHTRISDGSVSWGDADLHRVIQALSHPSRLLYTGLFPNLSQRDCNSCRNWLPSCCTEGVQRSCLCKSTQAIKEHKSHLQK